MSRISPVSEPRGEAATILSAVNSKLGMVPNLFATIAHSPVVLGAYLAFNDALSQGRLTAAQRELIALAVGQANQCQYCLSAHTLMAAGSGVEKQQITAARKGKAEDKFNQSILTLALALVEQRGNLTSEQLNDAYQNGVDDELIVEILAQVVANIFTNYTNHVAETEIDFPAVDLTI